MTTRIAINGFGRIGRQAFKIAREKPELEVVAINDIVDIANLAYLLKYDSVFKRGGEKILADGSDLIVNGVRYPVLKVADATELPWRELDIDVVMECTGRLKSVEQVGAHLQAGARAVIVSAPTKGAPSVVLGVNDETYGVRENKIFSSASCTTNSVAPVMAVLDEAFGVEKALMTTVHSYTADQRLVDSPHKDFRRGRAAAQNIVPTSTGAARAAAQVLPQLKGIFDGVALRVPTLDVSLSDITLLLKRKTTVEEINAKLTKASRSPRLAGILGVTDEPLVSADFVADPRSTIVDLSLTQVVGGDFVKVFTWYDNEWGYANRLVEGAVLVGQVPVAQQVGVPA